MYTALKESDVRKLRMERIYLLECDLARVRLMLEETPGNAELHRQEVQLMGFVKHHMNNLEAEQTAETESEPEPTAIG